MRKLETERRKSGGGRGGGGLIDEVESVQMRIQYRYRLNDGLVTNAVLSIYL